MQRVLLFCDRVSIDIHETRRFRVPCSGLYYALILEFELGISNRYILLLELCPFIVMKMINKMFLYTLIWDEVDYENWEVTLILKIKNNNRGLQWSKLKIVLMSPKPGDTCPPPLHNFRTWTESYTHVSYMTVYSYTGKYSTSRVRVYFSL